MTSFIKHCDVTSKTLWRHWQNIVTSLAEHCDITDRTLWCHLQNIVTSRAKHCDVTGKTLWHHCKTLWRHCKTLWRHCQNIVTSLADWIQNVQEFAETFDIFLSKRIPWNLMIRANDTRNKEPLLSGKAQYHWPPRTNHCDQLLF
jgi:hypothetical protein